MRYVDNHGEKTTKAFMIAAIAYALGGGGGAAFGGEANLGGPIASGAGGSEGTGMGGTGFSGSNLNQYLRAFNMGNKAYGSIDGAVGGGSGSQQQQPSQFNPFSPPEVAAPKDPEYQPMNFANSSFNPWASNVVSKMQKPYPVAQERIFSTGKGIF